ncbi:MAG: parallel beta-helix domain-containing protein [Anaerolineales bacterium]
MRLPTTIPGRIGLSLAALLAAAGLYLGFWPAPADTANLAESVTGAAEPAPPPPEVPGPTITVRTGESIQAALDAATPGAVILVESGMYAEELFVEVDYISLIGLGDGEGRPVLDGQAEFENGVSGTGHHFTMENFIVRNYRRNGVLVTGVEGVTLRNILTENTGEYGLFPIHASGVLVENCVSTGASDTGIYVGQSRDIVIQNNEAYENVSGFEVENSVGALVANNYAHDNTAGILVFVLNRLDSKIGTAARIVGNRVENNNLSNFAPEGIVQQVPAGTGVLIMAADDTEVTGNTITGNRSVGVAIISARQVYDADTVFDMGAEAEDNWVHDNAFENNGFDPHARLAAAGLPGADLLWDTSGWSNRWDETTDSAFPAPLPRSSWPVPVRRAWWRILSTLAKLL